MPARIRRALRRALLMLGLVTGIAIMCAPSVMSAVARARAEAVITTLEDTVDVSQDELRLAHLAQAVSYNRALAGLDSEISQEELWDYDDQMSWKGKPYMAWIHIPKIALRLPIYHGTADAELAQGVGHLEGRSLPVGGERSICVLEGHSGLRQVAIFDDIRDLERGDKLCIWSLAEPYAYEVVSWHIVEPEEVLDHIQIPSEPEDAVVLVTCTTEPDALNPKGRIGVNDRRLVVRALRCAYDPADFESEGSIAEAVVQATTSRMLPATAAAIAIAAVALAAFVRALARAHRRARH